MLDWRYGVVGRYDDELSVVPARQMLNEWWWPWALAVATLLLGAAALVWVVAHARRAGPGEVRMSASNESGLLAVDVRAVSSAVAEELAATAPLVGVRGTTRTHGAHTVIEVRGHVDPSADWETISSGARACREHVSAAFPDETIECRVLLEAPRRQRRLGRDQRVRVR